MPVYFYRPMVAVAVDAVVTPSLAVSVIGIVVVIVTVAVTDAVNVAVIVIFTVIVIVTVIAIAKSSISALLRRVAEGGVDQTALPREPSCFDTLVLST